MTILGKRKGPRYREMHSWVGPDREAERLDLAATNERLAQIFER